MTTRDLARRTATDLSALLSADSRAGFAWQQRFRQIAVCLSADASDDEALRAARAGFEGLYAPGRDFADFHLWRADPGERVQPPQNEADLQPAEPALAGGLRLLRADARVDDRLEPGLQLLRQGDEDGRGAHGERGQPNPPAAAADNQ